MRLVKRVAVVCGQTRPCRRSPCRGGAAVEFALVLPIFLAMLFGMIDYGWYFYQRFTLAMAIRDGVRYGVTLPHCVLPACPGPATFPWSASRDRAKSDLALPGSPINPLSVVWDPANHYSLPPDVFLTLHGTMPFTPLVGFVRLPATISFQMSMLMEIKP